MSKQDLHGSVNLEYYRVFCSVCECGGITAAAEALCISQPAVSQAVRQLETALGCRLFLRTSRGVKLTSEGEVLLSYVRRGIDAIQDGETMLRRMKDLETGEIRIGASDMTLQFYLLPYLEQFHEQYPNIKVTVSNGPTPETLEALYQGHIDFGIVSTPFETKQAVKSLPVQEIRNVFIAGPKYAAQLKGRKLSYKELLNCPCIFLERNTSTRRFMDEFLAKRGVRLEPEFELATSDMLIQFAVRNLGIASVVRNFAVEHLKTGDLFELRFLEEIPARTFCIVANERIPLSAAAATLMNVLVQGTSQ